MALRSFAVLGLVIVVGVACDGGGGAGEGDDTCADCSGEGEGEGEGDDAGPCVDADADGFYDCTDANHPERPADVDCDDSAFSVQPGGVEFLSTPTDDNCDDSDDGGVACGCALSADGDGDEVGTDLAAAMDLCGGAISYVQRGADHPQQYDIVTDYFGVAPRANAGVAENGCLVAMSTGTTEGSGVSTFNGGCGNNDPDPDNDGFSNSVCDLAGFEVHMRAPGNAVGLRFDFMFLSYEWPEYLCQSYNDTFYAIVTNEEIRGGLPTNAAFDDDNNVISVNAAFFENAADWSVNLDSTPYGAETTTACSSSTSQTCTIPDYCDALTKQTQGSGTGWLSTEMPIASGKDVVLRFTVHDESDTAYDSLVLLDHFEWLAVAPEKPHTQHADP